MSKLLIHETDCHSSGYYCYEGKVEHYTYDDIPGDMKAAVQALIDIGFIKKEDVIIVEGADIYAMIKEAK